MKTTKLLLTTTSILSMAVLSAQTSSAQPSGSITKLVVGSSNVLWDFSLLTNELQNLNLSLQKMDKGATDKVEIDYADPFTQNGHGNLAGSGTNEVTLIQNGVQTNTFTAKYTSSGSVTASKGVAHLTFMSQLSGKAVLPGETNNTAVSATVSYVVKFDANKNEFSGRALEQARVAGTGYLAKTKAIGPSPISDLAAELGNGTWTLALDFGAATDNKLSGTATVTLNSGQVYPFDFKGTYAPRTKESKLNLKGVGAGKGSVLEVMLDGSDITRITGQVAGQSVDIK